MVMKRKATGQLTSLASTTERDTTTEERQQVAATAAANLLHLHCYWERLYWMCRQSQQPTASGMAQPSSSAQRHLIGPVPQLPLATQYQQLNTSLMMV